MAFGAQRSCCGSNKLCDFECCQEDQLSMAVPCQDTNGMLIITQCHTLSRILLVGSFIELLSVWRGENILCLKQIASWFVL